MASITTDLFKFLSLRAASEPDVRQAGLMRISDDRLPRPDPDQPRDPTADASVFQRSPAGSVVHLQITDKLRSNPDPDDVPSLNEAIATAILMERRDPSEPGASRLRVLVGGIPRTITQSPTDLLARLDARSPPPSMVHPVFWITLPSTQGRRIGRCYTTT